ncbi:MAG TPA: hypothetical protein VN706_11095 [Gemmatimonadaceae bacterium]|nr:hypothetical protein [Gemmatimonadaceae bacterium]
MFLRSCIALSLALSVASVVSAQQSKPSAQVAVVLRLYADYACEAVVEPFCDAQHELVDQPRAVLARYFDDRLVRLWLTDRARAVRTREVGNLDFSPIWDSQDATGSVVRIVPTADPTIVDAKVYHGSMSQESDLRYTLIKTTAGWRIHDIARGTDWSLVALLSK